MTATGTTATTGLPFTVKTDEPIQVEHRITEDQLETAGILLGVVVLTSLALNVYTFHVVLKNWHSFIKFPFCQSNILCMFLSLADILLAVLVGIPTAIRYVFIISADDPSFIFYCRYITYFLIDYLFVLRVLIIVAVSIDRSIHIIRPLAYKFYVSNRVTATVIMVLCLIPIIVRVIPNLVYIWTGDDEGAAAGLICTAIKNPNSTESTSETVAKRDLFSIPLLCMIHVDEHSQLFDSLETIMYIETIFYWTIITLAAFFIVLSNVIIISVILKRAKRQRELCKGPSNDDQKKKMHNSIKKNMVATVIMAFAFLLSNIPFVITMLSDILKTQAGYTIKWIENRALVKLYFTLATFLSLLINPWLYPLRMETIRKFFPCFKTSADSKGKLQNTNNQRGTVLLSIGPGDGMFRLPSSSTSRLHSGSARSFTNLCAPSTTIGSRSPSPEPFQSPDHTAGNLACSTEVIELNESELKTDSVVNNPAGESSL